MPHSSHSFLFYYLNNIRREGPIVKFLVMYSSSLPCHLGPLKPKYFSQHPVLERPQPIFLPQCDRPSFAHVRSFVKCFEGCKYFFLVRSCQHLDGHPSCRTTTCQLSATAYSIYSPLIFSSGGRFSIRNLRTHHTLVTGPRCTRASSPTVLTVELFAFTGKC